MDKSTRLDGRRTQHTGVLSNGMWSAHAREDWRPIGRFNGKYEVSSLGRVRTTATGQVKSQQEERKHYRSRFYFKGRFTCWIHQLVAEAFIGPRPVGMEVRHLDGNGLNNVPSNLAYGTHQQNMWDRRGHGTNINRNTDKTHCLRGHEFTASNTYRSRGKRMCKMCSDLRVQWKKNGEWDHERKCHISERKESA